MGAEATRARASRAAPRAAARAATRKRPRPGVNSGRLARALAAALILCGLTLATVWGAGQLYRRVAGGSWSVVKAVRVSGLKHVRQEDFLSYIGNPAGTRIMDLDMKGMAAKAASHPWIREAAFKRELPDTLRVEVMERNPAVVVETGGGRYVVDDEGLALARVRGGEWGMLPAVQYPSSGGLKVLDPATSDDIKQVLALLAALRAEPSERLSGARLWIGMDRMPYIGVEGMTVKVGQGDYGDKVRRLAGVFEDIRARGAGPVLVDLRFPGKVVVKGAGTQ